MASFESGEHAVSFMMVDRMSEPLARMAALAALWPLTVKQVEAIRRRYSTGHYSEESLARYFGVDPSVISRIVAGGMV